MKKSTAVVGALISLIVVAGLVYGLVSPDSEFHQNMVLTPVWMKGLSMFCFGGSLAVFVALVRGRVEGIGYVVLMGALVALGLAMLINFGNNTY